MEKRGSIIGGMILILLGAGILMLQLFPELAEFFDMSQQWPLIILFAGFLFLMGALFGNPPLAIPGMVISGTGLILYYQNSSGDWASWSYIWSLYPGFVGLGIILMHTLQGTWRQGLREGGGLLVISAILFVVFGAFFTGLGGLSRWWPVFVILGGLWLLWKNRPAASKGKKLD
jgi:hypothetical protein